MEITRRLFTAGLLTLPSVALQLGSVEMSVAGEPRVLRIAQGFDPVSLWPNYSTTQEQINVGNLIVESLFWMPPDSQDVQPILAESYEAIDEKTIRIAVRKNVRFSNGEELNADAVLHSIAIFMDLKVTPAYGRYSSMIESATKAGDHALILHLKHPYPAMPLILSQIFIVPPAYWQEVGPERFGSKPIGTGPFKLAGWVRDSELDLEANADYWGESPQGIDRIILRPIPDDMVRASALLAGEYELATNIPIVAVEQITGQPDLDLISVPSYRIFSIALSNLPGQESPMHDKRVRQAVNYAVDKQGIIDGLFQGKAQPLHGQLLREPQIGFNPNIKDYPYDPEKARMLLAEAGYPDGFDIIFKFPIGRYAQDKEVAEAVAGMLAEVNVRAQMVSLEPGEFLRQLSGRELQPMGYVGLAPADDPDIQLSQYRSDWRYSYANNPELDALIDAGAMEMDREKRAETYSKAMELMHDEAHVLFLYQAVDLYGASKRLKGFNPRGDQRWVIHGMTLD